MRTLAAAALIATSSLAIAGPNLIVNGDFESGDTGWQKGDNMTIGLVSTTDRGKSAGTGCIGPECLELPNYASLNQTIHTSVGKTYEFSFWVAEYLGSPSGFAVYWDGNLIERVTDPANNSLTFIGNNVFEGTWTQFTYKGLVASSASTGIELRGRHDPGGLHIDDISVVEETATDIPEPGSLALLGLGALVLMSRRTLRTAFPE